VDTPTYNAEGQAVWKPQPGEYWKGGLRYAHSYGGIVSALQDLQASQGGDIKTYPNNFAGIIAAIEDLMQYLQEGTLPDVGAPPPGWEIIINPDGSIDGGWQKPPQDGQLWFDTRQGRLFIAIDKEWVQTNGGDGISHVGPNPPTNPPVIGQHWLDTDTGLFYVYIGEGIWQAVVSDGDITITTATLPLAIARTRLNPDYSPQIIPELPGLDEMQVQKDYNTYIAEALVNLDKAITEGSVSISDTPPTENVVPGTLWYDSETLELSIWYEDADSGQWVPTSVGYEINEIAGALDTKISQESQTRAAAIDHIYSMISSMNRVDDARVDTLEASLTALETVVNSLEIPDVSPFATTAQVNAAVARISSLETADIDLSAYATNNSLASVQASLLNTINSKTHLELSDITPLIPDISNKVEQSDIDASIADITTDFLPRTGGQVDGSFIINKSQVSEPAFDVSQQWYSGQNFMKLQSYSPSNSTTTFGSSDRWWELAWDFDEDEDFAWVYRDTNKVFSITKDGPACSQLHIGTFRENDANGRSLTNKIEVGQTLRNHSQVFIDLRQAISDSSDYASLKSGLLQVLQNV
jgi:hypothetical protein